MKREPKHYAYWKSIVEDPEKAAEIMIRGNDRQKKQLKKVFKFLEQQKSQAELELF